MKKVVIGITGSIAIYKTCEIISRLKKKNYDIEVIMTESATKFITPLTFGALILKPVLVDDFDETGYQIKHINIVKEADCFIVVPATANVIAKIANGIADDVLTSSFLAATCPKIIAPAMNVHMYENTATQKNLDLCRSYGIKIVEPEIGDLACGYQGKGHLSDIEDILDAIEYMISPHPLQGKHVLITAGPTQESLDPVRFISNHSSGKMGYALARAARKLGAHVTLISGPSQLRAPYEVDIIKIQSAQGMFKQVLSYFDLNEIDKIILETNGKFSFYPKTLSRPLKLSDLNHQVQREKIPVLLMLQGNVIKKNLVFVNRNEEWLKHILKVHGLEEKNIEILYLDSQDQIQFYTKNNLKRDFV